MAIASQDFGQVLKRNYQEWMKNKHSTWVLIKHIFLPFLTPISKTAGITNSKLNKNLPLVVRKAFQNFITTVQPQLKLLYKNTVSTDNYTDNNDYRH